MERPILKKPNVTIEMELNLLGLKMKDASFNFLFEFIRLDLLFSNNFEAKCKAKFPFITKREIKTLKKYAQVLVSYEYEQSKNR